MKKRMQIYSTPQLVGLVALRVFVGWHFLFEGVAKILNPKWSSFGYLQDAKGFLQGFYHWIANDQTILHYADLCNMVGLTLIGLGLMLGCLSRWASFGGIAMLLLYFFSHIPYIGANYILPSEGSYLWIDKNIIEIAALSVIILFPTSQIIGIDRFLNRFCTKNKENK